MGEYPTAAGTSCESQSSVIKTKGGGTVQTEVVVGETETPTGEIPEVRKGKKY